MKIIITLKLNYFIVLSKYISDITELISSPCPSSDGKKSRAELIFVNGTLINFMFPIGS